MLEYAAFNKAVFKCVPNTAVNILDVGCGTASLGKALKEENNRRNIYGITYSSIEANIADQILNKVYIADINNAIPKLDMQFDCIIFSHILEHTYHPKKVLKSFCDFLTNDGSVIIALPNVLQYKQRMEFFKGKFKYSKEGGLMDITHYRFFDWLTAQQMIRDADLNIVFKESEGNFPLPLVRKLAPSLGKSIDKFALKHWPGLFGFQFVFIAKK